MKNIIGTMIAVGLVLCFVSVSGMESGAILPSVLLGITGAALVAVGGGLLNTFNIDRG